MPAEKTVLVDPALWENVTEEGRAKLMRDALERIAASPTLSRDTFEQVTRSLD